MADFRLACITERARELRSGKPVAGYAIMFHWSDEINRSRHDRKSYVAGAKCEITSLGK